MRVISQIHTTTAHIHSILAVRFLSFNVEIAAHRKFIHFFVINFQLLKQQEEKKNKRFILSCHTTQKKIHQTSFFSVQTSKLYDSRMSCHNFAEFVEQFNRRKKKYHTKIGSKTGNCRWWGGERNTNPTKSSLLIRYHELTTKKKFLSLLDFYILSNPIFNEINLLFRTHCRHFH